MKNNFKKNVKEVRITFLVDKSMSELLEQMSDELEISKGELIRNGIELLEKEIEEKRGIYKWN